jgi:hypothetical protein
MFPNTTAQSFLSIMSCILRNIFPDCVAMEDLVLFANSVKKTPEAVHIAKKGCPYPTNEADHTADFRVRSKVM